MPNYTRIESHVEGCHDGLCLYLDCLLLALHCFFVGHRLSYACFGQICEGLVVLGATERIRPSLGTLFLENLAFLG